MAATPDPDGWALVDHYENGVTSVSTSDNVVKFEVDHGRCRTDPEYARSKLAELSHLVGTTSILPQGIVTGLREVLQQHLWSQPQEDQPEGDSPAK